MKKLFFILTVIYCYNSNAQIASRLIVTQSTLLDTLGQKFDSSRHNVMFVDHKNPQQRIYNIKWNKLTFPYDQIPHINDSITTKLSPYLKISDTTGKWKSASYVITSGQISSALGYAPYNGYTNPNGYISSYTETDPDVPSYAKTLLSFSIIKLSTDPLYKPIGYSPSSGEILSALGYTPYNGSSNPNGYISSYSETDPTVPSYSKSLTAFSVIKTSTDALYRPIGYAPSFSDLTSKPTSLSGYGITDGVNSGRTITINGVTYDLTANRSWTIATPSTWSYNNAPGRSIVTTAAAANGFQVSSTRNADVTYSVTISTTVSLSGNAVGYTVLEISPTNSSTAGDWVEISRVASGQSGTLVIGLVLSQTGGGVINGSIPAGWYARLRSVNTSGTPTFTYISGQEVMK